MNSDGNSFRAFTQCMVDGDQESLQRGRKFRRWGLAASVALQAGLLMALVLVPLVTPAVLPHFIALTPVPVLRPAAPERAVRSQTVTRTAQEPLPVLNTSLAVHVIRTTDLATPEIPIGIDLGPTGSSRDDVLSGLENSGQPAPPAPAETARGPIRKGSGVMEAMLMNRVEPIYLPAARLAHLSGPVVIGAVIATDGTIQSLRVVSGSPLLAGAALAAVREWRYKPTLLNGVPVEVETLITVNFVLDD